MDKADLAQATSKDESDLEAAPQSDATTAGTRATFLGQIHGYVFSIWGLLVALTILRFIKGLIIPTDPPPPKGSIEDADFIPKITAGWFSLLTFGWMNSLMTLSYAHPLKASDLWKLQDHRSAGVIAKSILGSFDARQKKADKYSARLANGEIKLPLSLRVMSRLRHDGEERLKRWRENNGKAEPSLTLSMNDAIKWWFWSGGVLKVISDTAQITSPLILKVGIA
jgi:hypothetical protein